MHPYIYACIQILSLTLILTLTITLGSYLMESLTDDLYHAAEKLIAEVEEMGMYLTTN